MWLKLGISFKIEAKKKSVYKDALLENIIS